MTINNDGTSILEVNHRVQRLQMFSGFVRSSQVVQEQARLEQGIVKHLNFKPSWNKYEFR